MTNQEWVKLYQQTRDAIMLRPDKAEGAAIREAAAKSGESLQQYVLNAVRTRMKKEQKKEQKKEKKEKKL